LHHWTAVAEKSLTGFSDENAAKSDFVKESRAEMVETLGQAGAEHYAFTAALDLSFLGLARYIRKRASPQ
jgi:hypothetical protein